MICLYVLDEQSEGLRPLGGAARWWLARSLRTLQNGLSRAGSPLVLRKGSAPSVIAGLACETGAGAVFWNEIAQAPHQAVADQVVAALSPTGVATQAFPGDLLVHPANIRNKQGRGMRVFRPFWRRVQALGDPPAPLPAPKTLRAVADLASDPIESWRLAPVYPNWAAGLREAWTPGEASAHARLKEFLGSRVIGYGRERDRPDRSGTSRLSPHLRFGEISPRQICRGRAPCRVPRYQQVHERTGLARILPPSAVRQARSRRA